MDIQMMQKGHILWDKTIMFAQSCSWKVGVFLAERMKANAFKDWERVVAAVENGTIVGYCTFFEKDELPEAYDYSPFIGFVFVDERCRGKRISEKMIRTILSYAKIFFVTSSGKTSIVEALPGFFFSASRAASRACRRRKPNI